MMRFVRHVAALTIASASIALASCTTLLGDFQVSATSDASVADGSADSPTGTDGTVDSPPGDDASPDSGCPSGQLSCAGSCVPSDVHNCGKCGHDCTNLPHVSGATTCTAGACVFGASACANGFADCNGMPDDGCEADLSQAAHCGSCTTACSGGTPVCASSGDAGTAFACASGCPSATPTLCSGSCVDTNTNAQNCHMCGTACPTVANAQATCSGGTCGFACNTNYHLCNGACADSTSVNSCGTSCTPCATVANGAATCTAGTCAFSCNTGFHACGGACADSTSPSSCGTSCTPCAAGPANSHTTCSVTGACGWACNANTNACGTTNSCFDLSSDSNNCGSCGLVCAGGQVCMSGLCACPAGQTWCNNSVCIDTHVDAANCGRCGHDCLGGTCSNSACNPYTFYSPSGAQPSGVVADSSFVYWVDAVAGGYGKVQVCRNAVGACASAVDFIASTPNATSGLPNGHGIAEGGGQIAVVGAGVSDGTLYGGARLESCAVVSGAPATCTPGVEISNGGGVGGSFARVATDGTNVAIADYSGIYMTTIGHPTQTTSSATQVYAANYGSGNLPMGVTFGTTAGATFLYWTVSESNGSAGGDSHKVFRCQLGGGAFPCSTSTTPNTPQLVYDGSTANRNPGAIVFDATAQRLFWVDQGATPNPPPNATDGKLLACTVGALPCAPTVLASGLASPPDLAQDSATLFFGTYGFPGTIRMCAKTGCGGAPPVIAPSESGVQFVSADSLSNGTVYWTTSGAVRRVAKP